MEWSVAGERPIQLSPPMAEAWLDAGNGSRIWRMAPSLSSKPVALRQVPMATEVVVGPSGIWVWPTLRLGRLCPIPLADPSTPIDTIPAILVR